MQEKNSNNIEYFFEKEAPGTDNLKLKFGIGIKEKIYSSLSEFKTKEGIGKSKIDIFDSYAYGKILAIDDIFQTSEKGEFIYHESIVHIPMIYHNNPKNILIIGGGDGGSLRECLKHSIDKATMVEIFKPIVYACNKYIPSIPNGAFENPKAELIIGDGREFIEKHENLFDIIILDLSDPEGPAEGLTSESFYKAVKKVLKKDGIVSIQSESLTHQPSLVTTMQKNIRSVFPFVKVHTANIPLYQGGLFSFTMASQKDYFQITFDEVKNKFKKLNLNDLKYLDPEIFFATRVIPKFLKKIVLED